VKIRYMLPIFPLALLFLVASSSVLDFLSK